MRSFFLIILCLSQYTIIIGQQAIVSGVVSIHNSEFETGTRQYVSLAQVEDEFDQAQAQTTNANGEFKLIFVNVSEKSTVKLEISKSGLTVVNTDNLVAIAGQKDKVKISMALPRKIADYRKKIYNVGKTSAEKSLEVKLNRIRKERAELIKNKLDNQKEILKLEDQIAQIEKEKEKIDQAAKILARKYAILNLDDTAPIYQEAFTHFQKGSLDTALILLQSANYDEQIQKLIESDKQIAILDSIRGQRVKDITQGLILKKDLHLTLYEFDSVKISYEMLLKLDSNRVNLLWEYGQFLANQNHQLDALSLFERALEINDDPQFEGFLYNSIGNLNRYLEDNEAAESAYKEALKIYSELEIKNKIIYSPYLALSLNNWANFQRSLEEYNEAIKSLKKALEIYLDLIVEDSLKYQPYLAMTYNNLGRVYYEKNKMINAKESFEHALDLYEIVVEQNPDGIVPDDLESFIALSLSYIDNVKLVYKFDKVSQSLLERALNIHRKLAERNPDQFTPFVALTLNNLGRVYSNREEVDQAEKAFDEALILLRKLAQKNPRIYFPFVAMTLNNLGRFYKHTGEGDKGKIAYKEAEEIEKKYRGN